MLIRGFSTPPRRLIGLAIVVLGLNLHSLSDAGAQPEELPAEDSPAIDIAPASPWELSTVTGRVIQQDQAPPTAESPGLTLTLRTSEGERTVYLGPRWFLDRIGFNLSPGETVNIIGFTIPLGGPEEEEEEPVVAQRIAAQDGRQWSLREPDGEPIWEEMPEAEVSRSGVAGR